MAALAQTAAMAEDGNPSDRGAAERNDSASGGAAECGPLQWARIASIPDAEGFAGPFAGVAQGKLLVAGGANFPEARPWQSGTKVWYDRVYVLDRPDGRWQAVGRLPRRLAYGVSISTEQGVVCLGGADAAQHFADCFVLRLSAGKTSVTQLPDLPRPCAYACGAAVGDTLFVAGGLQRPDDTQAMHTFWKLDLGASDPNWTAMPPWPGPERMLATAGVLSGDFYLFGGTSLYADAEGKAARRMLTDAYRFRPGEGWKRIADLPRPSVAAPSPAPAIGRSCLLVLGGDDGSQLGNPQESHRGFPRGIQAYNASRNRWEQGASVPFSLVTTTAVDWNDAVVVPGGEAKPGVRSTDVWSASIVRQ